MKKLFILFLICVSAIYTNAQTIEKSVLYKGTVEKMPVTLFLIPFENDCGIEPYYNAMYQYDGKSLWLQLSVSYNEKDEFVFVEEGGAGYFTGLLLLKKSANALNGTWISPDGKKQLKVQLKAVRTSAKELKNITTGWSNLFMKIMIVSFT